jgi:hypothetical protein
MLRGGRFWQCDTIFKKEQEAATVDLNINQT